MLTEIAHDLGIVSLAAGAAIIVTIGGIWARDALTRRRPGDVLDYIEPAPALWLATLRCTCTARLGECACAVDGVRNPRGAGRARPAPRPLGCPACRDQDCSTPAVCRAVARLYPGDDTPCPIRSPRFRN
ncbi:hypothetical protein [Bradyrhizobium sp. BTAi1]|jgi:hypothetical protein|uniref:hypothetical protein n=1 Tax=Bradyrhizobium sp. (strain BTAi1 / ATCC BAA-1182) TaxID=288000 RepID=UPI000306645D|nr:hypothetical protein [Bradyrhizobium sp. BTAi1]